MKIGILGGAFDPVHIGHLLVARDVQEKLELDKVLFMIAPQPPLKRCVESYENRLAMLKHALKPYPDFAVCEETRTGKCYTIDSLTALKTRHPQDDLYLLMGSDQFAALDAWKQPERLKDYARLVVMTRPDLSLKHQASSIKLQASGPAALARRVRFMPVRDIAVSSSEIRDRLRQGQDVRGMVTDSVLKMIVRKRLYRTGKTRKGRK